MKYIIGCIGSALLGSLFTVWLVENTGHDRVVAQERGPLLAPPQRSSNQKSPITPPTPLPGGAGAGFVDQLTAEEQVNIAVYENVNRSVVNITTKSVRGDGFFFELSAEGAGSGNVLDKTGHILTNYHVVEDAKQVSVTLFDGKSYDAKFVGGDPINDVAVIRVDAPAESLFPVVFGDSRRLKVGMRVFAIGNPFGLERTLTTGIISSLNRTLQVHEHRSIKSIIQVDAAINPGNSGGPLVDTQSRLIGMNTAIASKTGQSAGVGFAIPINLIARIVPQLIERGRVTRPETGIAEVYQTERGLIVNRLVPNGPAERAGLVGPSVRRRGLGFVTLDRSTADLIVGVDGQKTLTADDFLTYIESKEPGDRVNLQIIRKGGETRVTLQLGGGEVGANGKPAP
ncbi:MAG: trypsin-like peptidase domain-containing protein [Planctomycetales bacterium]|nr:trypsin-like peptidase domain-containing protein [Planctomycetales bacterium]